MQLDELGVFETPIALTNTFSVSAVAQAQIQQAFANHPEIGRGWPTVNPLVFECNDADLVLVEPIIAHTIYAPRDCAWWCSPGVAA